MPVGCRNKCYLKQITGNCNSALRWESEMKVKKNLLNIFGTCICNVIVFQIVEHINFVYYVINLLLTSNIC